MNKIIKQINDTKLLSQIERVVPFHGYLSTGAFIGIQMFNIAQQILGLQVEERIYATCETYNCIPDVFQILGGATIGNKGLRITDNGKMAVIINRHVPAGVSSARGVRIYLDPDKTQKYPRLHAWYLNTQKVPHEEAIYDLIEAGENVYSYEMVNVEVPIKSTKYVAVCKRCGEYFVCKDEETLCNTCAA